MSTTVRLDPATHRVLERMARRMELTKSPLIREAIRRLGESEVSEEPGQTVYDAMKRSIGCWDSGGAQLSAVTARKFNTLLRARHDSRGRRAT